jgi:hypothetical protein
VNKSAASGIRYIGDFKGRTKAFRICLRWLLINWVPQNMLFAMDVNVIARKLATFLLALTLVVGVVPVATAGTAMADCGMSMASMGIQASMAPDHHGVPMHDQQMPCKDMGGLCMATCGSAVSLSQAGYSPLLASKPAMPGWPAQAELAGTRARPDIPPPITIL